MAIDDNALIKDELVVDAKADRRHHGNDVGAIRAFFARDLRAEGTGSVEFFGTHQAGISTPAQDRLAFAAFDITSTDTIGIASTWAITPYGPRR